MHRDSMVWLCSRLLFYIIVRKNPRKNIAKNTPKIRLVAGTIFNYLIRKILSIDSKDTQAGFKFVNKNEFLNCTEFISSGFEYDIELFLLAKKNNIKTYSVDTSQLSKTDYSNVNIIPDSVRLFLKLFKLRQIYKINWAIYLLVFIMICYLNK